MDDGLPGEGERYRRHNAVQGNAQRCWAQFLRLLHSLGIAQSHHIDKRQGRQSEPGPSLWTGRRSVPVLVRRNLPPVGTKLFRSQLSV